MILKETTQKVKSIFKRNKIKAFLLINVLLFISCASKEETPEPVTPEDNTNPIGNIITATPKDLDGDGKVNDVAFKITATDNVAVENIDLTVNGDFAEKVGSEYILSDLAPGNYTAKLNVTDTSDNPSTEVTKIFTIEEETPVNNAPTLSVTLNDFDENNAIGKESNGDYILANNTPVGAVLGTAVATDIDGDEITVNASNADFDLEVTEDTVDTNGVRTKKFNIKRGTNLDADYENGDSTHNSTFTPNDGIVDGTPVEGDANEIDKDDYEEMVDYADITSTKSLDNTEITEDLSYTTVNSTAGTPVEIIKDKADNDQNVINKVHYLLDGFDADNNPIYIEKETVTDAVNASTQMDGASIDVMDSMVSGSYGILGFTQENIGGITYVINKHGETVDKVSFNKALRFFVDQEGTINESLSFAPGIYVNYAGESKEGWQIVGTSMIGFVKKMQQTGADKPENIIAWSAEAYKRVENMSAAERRKIQVEVRGEEGVVKYYD